MDGTTKASDRIKIVNDFQEGIGAPIFLLTSKVGGLGLTLTRADCVIVVDPAWNPSTDSQSVDCAHRIGQKKNVIVYRLMTCDTVEEKIYRTRIFAKDVDKEQVILLGARASRVENQDAIDACIVGMLLDPTEFMDIAHDELAKTPNEISVEKLQSLLDIALRSTAAATDPLHEDFTCSVDTRRLSTLKDLQIEEAVADSEEPLSITGVETFSVNYKQEAYLYRR